MKEAEFRKAVDDQKRLREDLEEEAVEAALEWYVDHNEPPFYPNKVGTVLNLAERFRAFGVEERGQWPKLSVGTVMRSDRLAEIIREDVVDIRRTLEARVREPISLPFDRYAEAVDWIKQTLEEREPSPEEIDHAEELRAELQTQVNELARVTRRRVVVRESQEDIQYVEPGESVVHSLPVPKDSPLWLLCREATRLAKATRFAEVWIIAYVLADVRPTLMPVTISGGLVSVHKLATGGEVRPREVRLTIRDADLTLEELRELFVRVRRRLGASNRKRLSDRDYALWEAVQSRGGPPEELGRSKAEKDYWSAVADEVGGYANWRGPYMRWRRMQERLPQGS